ncbi:MAG: NDP-sugar synthase [Myxococcota bacterium]
MNAMILAAGLGTRLRPLTTLRAKPALPVQGRAVICLLLEFLARQGIQRVMINLHYLPDTIRHAVAADSPEGMEILWSEEPEPLGTGGGIRRAADFLRETEECVVLAGDMLLDVDLRGLRDRHLTSGRNVTLLLREDPRGENFGTIGVDEQGRVSRIGERTIELPSLDSEARTQISEQGETETDMARGLFTGLRIFSREALDHWPGETAFEDLRDWLIPGIETRNESVGAEIVGTSDSVWEPVGTPAEYLRVNLDPPSLPSLGGDSTQWVGNIERVGTNWIDRTAKVPTGTALERSVVWDHESVPVDLRGEDGVFAGDAFHACLPALQVDEVKRSSELSSSDAEAQPLGAAS